MYSCVLLELSREVHGTSRLIDRAERSEYGLFQGRTHTTSGPLASGHGHGRRGVARDWGARRSDWRRPKKAILEF